MPKSDIIVNLPNVKVKRLSGYNPVIAEIDYTGKVECVNCGGRKLRKKSRYERMIEHEGLGHRRLILKVVCYKYCCYECGRYFNQRLPGIKPYQRVSEKLKESTFYWHMKGVSQKDLSRDLARGHSTIERWHHDYYGRFHRELDDRHCPRVLGIDEHFFSQKQGYATTLCDLEKHKIFDVVKGKSEASLREYLLSLKGRERVRVVCMDLSSTYRAIVQKYFPNAKIVADRFHVIRLMQHMFLKTCHQLDPEVKYQRGLLKLLRTKTDRLSETQLQKRAEYFARHAAIATVFEFKEKLYRLLMNKHRKVWQCKKLIPVFLAYVKQLKVSGFQWLKSLGKTLYSWKEAIVCMWRFTRSNGITEGFHRKMKLIQRRAYGFRNFENYRMRVKVLCG